MISCADSQPKEAKLFDQKMAETIAIHDDVMPKMTKITTLITTLESKADSTNAEVYEPTILKLKTGHDKMMEWMKSFGDEFSKTEINQGIQLRNSDSLKLRLKVLEESKQEAEDMKAHVMDAISNAEALLE